MMEANYKQTTAYWSGAMLSEALAADVDTTIEAYGVSIDSRTIHEGQIFIAIKGEHSDGHQFVKDALSKGAGAVIVSEKDKTESTDSRIIYVNDTFKALWQLATYQRSKVNANYIGVTGSVGKTTTKEMLKLLLSRAGKTYATFGNLNNHYGVPLTLCNMPSDTEYAVIEMGMNHAGEITPLSKLVRPHIVLITKIAPVHIEFFSSLEGIADAKAEICAGFSSDSKGIVVLNADDSYFDYLIHKVKQDYHVETILSAGKNNQATVMMTEHAYTSKGQEVVIEINKKRYSYHLSALGMHLVQNSLMVVAVLHHLSLNLEVLLQTFEHFTSAKGRGSMHQLCISKTTKAMLIDDSYNASPDSVHAALNVLGSFNTRKIAVLADMLELGERSEALHLAIIPWLEENNIDAVFLLGAQMKSVYKELSHRMIIFHVDSIETLEKSLLAYIQHDDVVLVKGSHGTKLYQLVEHLLKKHDGGI